MQDKNKQTILIVDDEIDILDLLKDSLSEVCVEILTAINGKVAMEIVKSKKIDVIISDYKMPVLDGVEFLRELRSLGYETPFIFFTAFSSDINKVIAASLDYLTLSKPFAKEEIKKVINAALRLAEGIVDNEEKIIKFCRQPNIKVEDLIAFRRKQRALLHLKKERLLVIVEERRNAA